MIPAPQPPMIAQFEVGANGRTESRRIAFTLAGVILGCIEYINATMPETTGVAMLVPSESRYEGKFDASTQEEIMPPRESGDSVEPMLNSPPGADRKAPVPKFE